MPTEERPKLRRPATLDHLKKKEPLQQQVPIVLNDTATEAVGDARRRLLIAETLLNQTDEEAPEYVEHQRLVDEAKVALERVLEEQDEFIVWITLRSIGRKRYEKLMDEHPPTDEQKEEAEKNKDTAMYNGDTFMPALVSACAVEPPIPFDEAVSLFDEWNISESFPLFQAAMNVCTGRRVAEMGNVFGGTQG